MLVSRAKLAALSGAPTNETDNDHRDRYKMASYLWAPDSAHLLFDSNGRLWLYDLHNGTGVQIGFTGIASGDDPKFSPNGELLSFVREHGLSVLRLKDPELPPTIVAPPPNQAVLNGEVDWVYEEELDTRSNYFWSPDSKSLGLSPDQRDAKWRSIPSPTGFPPTRQVNLQHYPQPGDPNPDVRVGVVGAGGGKTVWIKLPIQPAHDYIPRFGWVDRKTLWIETLTRDHKHRDLYFADAVTGAAHPVLQFTDDKFFDDNYDISVGYGSIVLTNWSDGHNHLYLYSYNQADAFSGDGQAGAAAHQRRLRGWRGSRRRPRTKLIHYASNEGNLFGTAALAGELCRRPQAAHHRCRLP